MSVVSEFRRGITQPSLTACGTALATIVGAFFATVSPHTLTPKNYLYFTADETDDYAYVTARVLELADSEDRGPEVILLGGSSIRSSVTGENELAELIAAHTGSAAPRVYDLCAGNMTTWEMAGVVGELGPDLEGVVALGLSPYTLADGADQSVMGREFLSQLVDQPRFGFAPRVFDEEVRLAGLEPLTRSGIYAVDNYPFFLARRSVLIENVRDGLSRFERPPYLGRRPFGRTYWDAVEIAFEVLAEGFRAHSESHLAIVARMAERAPSTSFAVVVPPLHPRQLRSPMTSGLLDVYRARLRRFANEEGMLYVDINEETLLLESDFLDPGHIRLPSVQARTTRALAERLGDLLAASEEPRR